MHDSLGNRMKEQYEIRTKYLLPRRTYTIIRVDGKNFSKLTKKAKKPFDENFANCMKEVALELCSQIQGARLAYVQSDEVSVLLTDFEKETTDAWFNGNIQKIASVSASIATATFNKYSHFDSVAYFDSRVFTIPDPVEVENYFIWRQNDCKRNSIQMAAQAEFSHKQLQYLNVNELQELLFTDRGINWNDYDPYFKSGGLVKKHETISPAPIFTQNREFLSAVARP